MCKGQKSDFENVKILWKKLCSHREQIIPECLHILRLKSRINRKDSTNITQFWLNILICNHTIEIGLLLSLVLFWIIMWSEVTGFSVISYRKTCYADRNIRFFIWFCKIFWISTLWFNEKYLIGKLRKQNPQYLQLCPKFILGRDVQILYFCEGFSLLHFVYLKYEVSTDGLILLVSWQLMKLVSSGIY